MAHAENGCGSQPEIGEQRGNTSKQSGRGRSSNMVQRGD